MATPRDTIPNWLATSEHYRPASDRDGFLAQNLLSLSALLARLRLDDGHTSRLSPSAPAKLLLALVTILLTSLARNYLFVLVVLALVLVRACLLPQEALSRMAATSGTAAALSFVLMVPAILLGQTTSAVLLATKALVATALTLTVALTTPAAELTSSLRLLGVPALVVLTVDLALRSIVRLGETASEVLVALRLRSVGHNPRKRASMGGVGGVVLVKAGRAAQDTHDAMRCRGFDGSYLAGRRPALRRIDLAWLAGSCLLVAVFAYLQKAV